MLSESLEDYLESILVLKYSNSTVRIKDLVEYHNVKNSSVVNAMKSLSASGHVNYEKYRHIDLTEAGLCRASRVYSKHRIIERFFENVLKIPTEKAKQMACEVEHHMEMNHVEKLNCLTTYLLEKNIQEIFTCAKSSYGLQGNEATTPLVLHKKDFCGVFVCFSKKPVRDRLAWMKLNIGERFTITRISLDGSIIEIHHGGGYHSISRDDAEAIQVTEDNNETIK